MKFLLVLLLLPCALFAQTVGDNSEKVIKLLGNPPLSRVIGSKEIWLYTNGMRVTFENGVVTGVSQSSVVAETERDTTNAPDSVPAASPAAAANPALAANPAYNAWVKHGSKASKAILVVAVLISMVCNLLIIIAAFKDGVGWGLAVLFIPFVNLIYILTHWDKVKKPVQVALFVAVPLLFLGVYLGSH